MSSLQIVCTLYCTLWISLVILQKYSFWLSTQGIKKMQQRAILWILDTFCILSSLGIKTITELVLIYLHLQKLSGCLQLRTSTLPNNHIIKSLLKSVICKSTHPEITSLQWSHLQIIQAHLSCNTSYGGAATIQVFRLLWQRYSYLTQSFMMELPLSVSQHWNLHSESKGFYYWNPKHLLYYPFVYKTSNYTVIR